MEHGNGVPDIPLYTLIPLVDFKAILGIDDRECQGEREGRGTSGSLHAGERTGASGTVPEADNMTDKGLFMIKEFMGRITFSFLLITPALLTVQPNKTQL
jgi:hypothetical protein